MEGIQFPKHEAGVPLPRLMEPVTQISLTKVGKEVNEGVEFVGSEACYLECTDLSPTLF